MISREELTEFFDYKEGKLFCKKKYSDKTVVRNRVGWQRSKNGYRQIGFKGKIYYEHRIIWLLVNGVMPTHQIDHINGIKDDNRIENLRDVSSTQNLWNIGKKRDNSSGEKNVHWCNTKKRWIVKLKESNKTKYIGSFIDLDEAKKVAIAERSAFHSGFVNNA